MFATGHVIGLRERHWLSTDVQFYSADNELFIYFGHAIAQGLKLYLDYSFSCKSYLSPCCITDLLSCVCAFTLRRWVVGLFDEMSPMLALQAGLPSIP